MPVQDMVGEESKTVLGTMSWVGRQSARRLVKDMLANLDCGLL